MRSLQFLSLAGCLSSASAAYTLQKNYSATNWMSEFSVQQLQDPTNGFVTYVSSAQAQSSGLYKIVNNQVYIGVDNTTVLDPNGPGRNSVRLSSNTAYNSGLFIADFAHIPATACGSWPAYWLTGPSWPGDGEIDIIEGINNQTRNQITIHTSPGCNVTVGTHGQTGTSGSNTNCGIGGGYDGCTTFASGSHSYGTGFNAAAGGVYALHWTASEIKVWLFSRAGIPADISAGGTPNPNGWGTPQASFAGCDFSKFFNTQSIMFNTDFCGDWAGKQWGASAACSKLASTCNAYAAANPHAYDGSYFLVNYVKVWSG